jgi:type II secretory pathway pseudopilin PulG
MVGSVSMAYIDSPLDRMSFTVLIASLTNRGCARPVSRNRAAFSLLELLIVTIIVALLMAALLPALGSCRRAARRIYCCNNLRNLAVATIHYERSAGCFPPGIVAESDDFRENKHSGFVYLLPFLHEQSLFDAYDTSLSWKTDGNRDVVAGRIRVLICPVNELSAGTADLVDPNGGVTVGPTDYAFCKGDLSYLCRRPLGRGMFDINSRTRASNVRDGLSQTIMLGEAHSFPGGPGQGWGSADLDATSNSIPRPHANRGGSGSVLAVTFQNPGPDGSWGTKDDVTASSLDTSSDAQPGSNCADTADRVRGFSGPLFPHYAFADGRVDRIGSGDPLRTLSTMAGVDNREARDDW